MDNSTVKNLLKQNFIQLKEVLFLLLPKNKKEKVITFSFLAFYLIYSLIFLFNTSIIDHSKYSADLYFGFDNTCFFHWGYAGKDSHPFLGAFLKPFVWIANLFGAINFKLKGIFFLLFNSVFLSLMNLYIYKYMRDIVELKGSVKIFLLLLFGIFSTNLILAFTLETYVISGFLLTFSAYMYALYMKKNKKIEFMTVLSFAFTLGGVTITNVLKGMIPYLYTKNISLKRRITNLSIVSALFGLGLLCVELKFGIFSAMFHRMNDFANPVKFQHDYFSQIVNNLMGATILLPKIVAYPFTVDYFPYLYGNMFQSLGRHQITFLSYNQLWQFATVISIYLLLFYSFLKNYRNKYVQILFLLLAVDIFVHIIMKYGTSEGFIYGSHYVYVIILMFAWLYKSFKEKGKKILLCVYGFLFLVLLTNNVFRIYTFYELAVKYFPPSMSGNYIM